MSIADGMQRRVLVDQLLETEDQESIEFFRKVKERRERCKLPDA